MCHRQKSLIWLVPNANYVYDRLNSIQKYLFWIKTRNIISKSMNIKTVRADNEQLYY